MAICTFPNGVRQLNVKSWTRREHAGCGSIDKAAAALHPLYHKAVAEAETD